MACNACEKNYMNKCYMSITWKEGDEFVGPEEIAWYCDLKYTGYALNIIYKNAKCNIPFFGKLYSLYD